MPAGLPYPPPTLPGITSGSGATGHSYGPPGMPPPEMLETPMSQLGRMPLPGQMHILQAIQQLQQALEVDPRLEPVIGPALQQLLSRQMTIQSPGGGAGGTPRPGGDVRG